MSAIRETVDALPLDTADAFIAVTVNLNERGEPIPTLTVVAPRMQDDLADEFRAHLRALFDTLKKAYAPKDGAK